MPGIDRANPYQSPGAKPGKEGTRPLWVRLGLWGISSRRAAMAFFWFSLFTSAGCLLGSVFDGRFFVGVPLLFAASWYWACIRWVDLHDDWN